MKKLFALLAAALLTVTVAQAQTNSLTATAPQLSAGTTQLRAAPAEPALKGWTVSFGGVGMTAGDNFGNDWQWSGEVGISKLIPLTDTLTSDLGFRQAVGYGTVGYTKWSKTEEVEIPCSSDTETVTTTGKTGKDGWMLRSEIFYDVNIPLSKVFTLFVGPNFGVYYGNLVPQWTLGPEGGVKIALGKNWDFYTRAGYDWVAVGEGNDGFRFSSGFMKTF